jgi:hypothetical protein
VHIPDYTRIKSKLRKVCNQRVVGSSPTTGTSSKPPFGDFLYSFDIQSTKKASNPRLSKTFKIMIDKKFNLLQSLNIGIENLKKASVVYLVNYNMKKKFVVISTIFCSAIMLTLLTHQESCANVASKEYVDRMVAGNNVKGGYEVKSQAIENAVTNDEFWVDMDDLRFRVYKASSKYHWGLRIRNISNGTISVGASYTHVYGSAAQYKLTSSESLAPLAEINPDHETSDVGYGDKETNTGYVFNHTSMNVYRFTISVFESKAIITVERLH